MRIVFKPQNIKDMIDQGITRVWLINLEPVRAFARSKTGKATLFVTGLAIVELSYVGIL